MWLRSYVDILGSISMFGVRTRLVVNTSGTEKTAEAPHDSSLCVSGRRHDRAFTFGLPSRNGRPIARQIAGDGKDQSRRDRGILSPVSRKSGTPRRHGGNAWPYPLRSY